MLCNLGSSSQVLRKIIQSTKPRHGSSSSSVGLSLGDDGLYLLLVRLKLVLSLLILRFNALLTTCRIRLDAAGMLLLLLALF
jgi:hypothetical protein